MLKVRSLSRWLVIVYFVRILSSSVCLFPVLHCSGAGQSCLQSHGSTICWNSLILWQSSGLKTRASSRIRNSARLCCFAVLRLTHFGAEVMFSFFICLIISDSNECGRILFCECWMSDMTNISHTGFLIPKSRLCWHFDLEACSFPCRCLC